jgi:hypothetical protein
MHCFITIFYESFKTFLIPLQRTGKFASYNKQVNL